MGLLIATKKGFLILLCALFTTLVMYTVASAQDFSDSKTLLLDYDSLRIEFQGNFRDTVYIKRLFEFGEIAKEQEWADVLLKIGLENWPTINAIGFHRRVIDDIEYTKASTKVILSEFERTILNIELLEAYSSVRNTLKGITIANEIIDNSQDQDAVASARGFLATFYSNAGWYKESAEILFENLVYFESTKDTSSQIATLNNLAQLNETLYNFSFALELYKRAELLALESGDKQQQLLMLSSLGVYYKKIEDFESATNYYLEAIELSQAINDLSAYAQNNFNLGNIYYEQGNYNLASDRYNIAYKIAEELNYRYPIALIGIMRGTLLMDLDALSSAESYFIEAEQIMSEVDDLETQTFLDQKLSELYERRSNFKKALEYNKKVVSNQQKISEQGSLDSLNQELMNYELRQAELLNENQRIEAKRNQQTNVFFGVLVFVLCLGFFIALIMNRKKKVLIEKLFANAENEFTKSVSISGDEQEELNYISLDIFRVELGKTKETGNRRQLFYELFDIIVKDELFKMPGLGLNQLAKKANSNTSYVSEAINTNLEMGFNAFINRIRAKKAKYLLLYTNLTIDEVMDECGYRNRSTFYRAFQSETGLTPGEFVQKRSA